MVAALVKSTVNFFIYFCVFLFSSAQLLLFILYRWWMKVWVDELHSKHLESTDTQSRSTIIILTKSVLLCNKSILLDCSVSGYFVIARLLLLSPALLSCAGSVRPGESIPHFAFPGIVLAWLVMTWQKVDLSHEQKWPEWASGKIPHV